MFNWRYWVPFKKEQVTKSPEYLKRKSTMVVIIKALKKIYPEDTPEMQKAIQDFSKACRKSYPELNQEVPL
jgi:hypothetical protein